MNKKIKLCECGCGQETKIYRGKPRRYIRGHAVRCMSIETREKKSKSMMGVNKGKFHSDKTRKKISESNKNPSDETRMKMSKARTSTKASDETKKKMSEAKSGEKNHNWQGGISFEPYCPKFNEAFKERIREKFGRVCFICGKTEVDNGQKLSVHHVQYNKNCGCDDALKCDFVPLCKRCHSKTNNNHGYWENLIVKKLS